MKQRLTERMTLRLAKDHINTLKQLKVDIKYPASDAEIIRMLIEAVQNRMSQTE